LTAAKTSGVLERVKKLEKEGVIVGYEVRLDPKAVGLALTVFMHIKTSDAVGRPAIGQEIAEINGIQEVHWIAGEYNYLIKARVNSTDGLTDLMKAIGRFRPRQPHDLGPDAPGSTRPQHRLYGNQTDSQKIAKDQ
jgi:DNA-binding Lrp family transcriptional regulator